MAITAVITTPMNTAQAIRLNRLLTAALLLLATVVVYVATVAAIHTVGLQQSVSRDDNRWLSAAALLSFQHPDVQASLGGYQRRQAMLWTDNAAQQQQLLTQSLQHWQAAVDARPLWPYHHLGALDVEILLNKPAADIQQRIDQMIIHTPNERGLDKSLLELAAFGWPKLTTAQQGWMLARLNKLRSPELRYVLAAAQRAQRKAIFCAYLPLKKSRRFCR